MINHFNAVFQRDGEWIAGYCPEVPGANGQGRTQEECEGDLAQAISVIFEEQGAPLDPASIRFNQNDD